MRGLLPLLLLCAAARAGDEWLAENAVPFRTVEAGRGFEDLQFLKERIGDARIVALGEPTHGSREVFRMKHRLLEFLATEMGFTIFSIEASLPESFAVNDYVEHGKGDPAALITGMYFWTWRTEEVRAMVEWMRAFNASGKGPLRFTGFDMQTPDVAASIVTAFAPDLKSTYDAILLSAPPVADLGAAGGPLPVEALRGKTVRLSGQIRTEEAGAAALWLRADRGGKTVVIDSMRDRAPSGTVAWKECHVEIDVPADADAVHFGVILARPGKAWFDELRIKVDGAAWKPESIDLDFEGERIEGLRPATNGYRATLVRTGAASGKQCLGLECISKPGVPDADAAARLAQEALDRLAAFKDAPGFAWAEQNARVVLQCMRSRANLVSRDQCMAENVGWILRRNPGAKIVLWAHNGHVARKPGWMGDHLDAAYGQEYVPVGFTTRRGAYRAVRAGSGLVTSPLAEPPEGSWELRLASVGGPLLLVDLRSAPPELRAPIPMRSIGALVSAEQFYPHEAPAWFDLLVYIEETSAAVELKR